MNGALFMHLGASCVFCRHTGMLQTIHATTLAGAVFKGLATYNASCYRKHPNMRPISLLRDVTLQHAALATGLMCVCKGAERQNHMRRWGKDCINPCAFLGALTSYCNRDRGVQLYIDSCQVQGQWLREWRAASAREPHPELPDLADMAEIS